MFFSRSLLALVVALVLLVDDAVSQVSQAEIQFLNRILDASNSVSAGTEREAHARCVSLSKELAKMADVVPQQRLYLEAEIESCLSYAMNNGKFSDANGDACSHHYAFATKLAQVIAGGRGQPGYAGDLMQTLGDRLKRATELGPQIGCQGDYAAFAAAIATAEAESVPPPPPAWRQLLGDIGNEKYEITAETAREVQKRCLSYRERVAALPELTAVERLYSEALIEDCVARAKGTGNYSDELGDVCTHHHRFATKLAEGLAAGRNEPAHEEMLLPIMRGELETAKRQGPGMECKQDYESLKAD